VPVAGGELDQRLRIDAAHVDELLEEVLEAGRGDDLQDPGRLVAGVPERVPLVARLEDQVAGLGHENLVAEQRADLPLQDVAVLVLSRVPVQRRGQGPRTHRVLDEREVTARLLPVDHEPDADAAEEPGLAVLGPDHLRLRCCRRFHAHFLSLDSIVARIYTQVRPVCQDS
jgi:hypothetical protein